MGKHTGRERIKRRLLLAGYPIVVVGKGERGVSHRPLTDGHAMNEIALKPLQMVGRGWGVVFSQLPSNAPRMHQNTCIFVP